MTVYSWIKDVQDGGSLPVFAEKAFAGGWATILDSSVKEFNRLMDRHKIGLVLAHTANAADAHIVLNSASKHANVSHGGTDYAQAFDGTYTHGLTRRIHEDVTKLVLKAYVFVPATPRLVRGDAKSREVGPEVRRFILIHEFIHAAGVGDYPKGDEHTLDDVFCSPISIVEGKSAAGDRARTQGRNAREMPPYEINDKTVSNLKKAWPTP